MSLPNEIQNGIHTPDEGRSRKYICRRKAWKASTRVGTTRSSRKTSRNNGWKVLMYHVHALSWSRPLCFLDEYSNFFLKAPLIATKHRLAMNRASTPASGPPPPPPQGQRRRQWLRNLGQRMCIQWSNNGMAAGEQLSYQARKFN